MNKQEQSRTEEERKLHSGRKSLLFTSRFAQNCQLVIKQITISGHRMIMITPCDRCFCFYFCHLSGLGIRLTLFLFVCDLTWCCITHSSTQTHLIQRNTLDILFIAMKTDVFKTFKGQFQGLKDYKMVTKLGRSTSLRQLMFRKWSIGRIRWFSLQHFWFFCLLDPFSLSE